MVGSNFHYWTVVSSAGSNKHKQKLWNCVCKCGAEKKVLGISLRAGKSKSCGCYQKEVAASNQVHGMHDTREYRIWSAMKTRCNNPKAENYSNYGGRGITVCDDWNSSFESFYKDMGDSNGMTIERIDNSLGYSPDNCRWASMKEQGNNKRNNNFIQFNGVMKTASQWARDTGINESCIRKRIRLGWDVDKALTEQAVVGRNQHANN